MLCVLLGCLILASACGGAGTPTGTEAGPASSDTVPQTTAREAGDGEVLAGTADGNVMRAGSGDDVVRGMGGDDEIYGGEGKDRLFGGPGNDLVDAQDPDDVGGAGRDEISCGPGRDEVLMDADDEEKPRHCEMAGVGSS
ncbi:MAG: Alkaline phosphatase [uncultured Rubrobacteraceae bacterium]|uniref:Alkaline phosphatase n=1 Tax=uncultured Rubrobacteraceae bacterium TaxID=349277 RepID=A0A6J4QJI3_9ACTN|nr:MAG: Alkaline phosphatase [uncultured Rubrobacteraceae bacterium]